jgi:hypothetical protein
MKVDLCKTNGSSPPCISSVHVVSQAAGTLPNPRETVTVALEDPAIRGAIQRGARKAQVKKYAAVTKNGRDGVCEYTSDFEQATYLALLQHHAENFSALTPEERTEFVENLAKSIAWKQVYRMKLEVPVDRDRAGSEGSSLESELIERIDRQRAATPPEEQTETKYERMYRLLGAEKADWMLDYENRRYDSPKTSAERVRYCRLRKKLNGM